MKIQMTVRTFTGGVSTVAESDWTECDANELTEVESLIKRVAENGNYLKVGPVIIPGEFLRNHCVVDIRTE